MLWDKLTEKLHHHKSKKNAPEAPAASKQDNVKASGPVAPASGLHNNGSKVEKLPVKDTLAPAPSNMQQPSQLDAPLASDIWREALEQLPQEKQKKLESLGLDKLNSGPIKTEIDGLVDAVNKRQEECEQKFWRITIRDNDIVLRDYTARIIDWAQKAGDIAVQFAPSQAGGPWAVLKALMQIPVIEGEQMAALMGVTEKIVRIISRGQVYEQVYLSNAPGTPENEPSKTLRNVLLKIYTTSLELLADCGELLSQSTARRTLEAVLNPGDASGGLSSLTDQEEDLVRHVQACEVRRSAAADDRMVKMLEGLNAPLTRVDKKVQAVLERMEKHQRIELLEWISPIQFGDHHGNVKEKRTPGTGEWLLQDESFCNWERSSSSGIFLLQGSPGTGKTYLTSRVIDLFQGMLNDPPKDEGFAFFYCDKNEESRRQAHSILRSYVRQLSTTACSPGSIQTQLREACENARSNGANLSFETCKKQISESLGAYPKTTLVIDALDECVEFRDQLIDAVNYLLSDSKNTVKVFISTRPDPELQYLLKGSASVTIEASHNQADIREFLEQELGKFAIKAPFIQPLKAQVIDKLLKRCQGMFLLAALQVARIVKCKTKTSVLDRLGNLPKDLQRAYDEIWDEIESLEEPDKTLAKRALMWVMAAYKPMKSSALLSAVRVTSKEDEPFLADEIDEQGLLSLCNNFLVIDSKLRVWRFSHLSVTEYLEAQHHWTLARANSHAAIVCLSFFIRVYKTKPSTVADEPTRDDPDMPWEVYLEEIPDQNYDIFDTMNPFHIYMRHYWVVHVHESQSPEQSTVGSLLKTFLGAPDKSSVQYRRWFNQIKDDYQRFGAIIDGSSPYEISGFQGNRFEFYKSLVSPGVWRRPLGSELEPESVAILAMCRFAFDTILLDWWENKDIDVSLLNSRGHDLLMVAAIGGSVPICERLIARGIDVNLRIQTDDDDSDTDYGSALVAAAYKGQTKVLNCLVEAGADVHMTYPRGHGWFGNALVAAIDGQHLEAVKYLVQEAKADVNMPPLQHELRGSVLGRAIIARDEGIIEFLLNAGADPNKPIEMYGCYSALEAAVRTKQLHIVKHLVQKGADANMPVLQNRFSRRFSYDRRLDSDTDSDWETFGSILEAAARSGKVEIVKYLVEEAHADVNVVSSQGHGSPLAVAASAVKSDRDDDDINYMEIFKYLVQEAGADVNQLLRCGEYGSALAAADEIGEIELLLKAGADVNMPLPYGDFGSALAAAAARGSVGIVKLLIEAGANVNMSLPGGKYGSALAASAAQNNFEVLNALLEAGADVNMSLVTGDYGSALIAAAAREGMDKYDTLRALLDAGADANMHVPHGKYGSALVAAASSAAPEFTQCLLEAGANPNMQVSCGIYGSALAAAASRGSLRVVKLLIGGGADVNMPLHSGRFPNALAARVCADKEDQPGMQKDSARFLLEAGANVNLELEDTPLTTPLQAAQSAVTENIEWIWRNRSSFDTEYDAYYDSDDDVDKWMAELMNDIKREREEVAELLRHHGATA